MANWNDRFIRLACYIAQWSKDPSTKVGAVIVDPSNHSIKSTGFNGFAPSSSDAAQLYADRKYKYEHIIHAEDNALRFLGFQAQGFHLYTSFPACPNCLRLAAKGGIVKVFQPKLPTQKRSLEWLIEWRLRLEESEKVAAELKLQLVTVR